MPVSVPPPQALAEFLGPTTRHTRRIEIYESDGVTRWAKDTIGRLKGGTVTVDYDRDERRGLDLTLSNDDGVLINAPGEFWYDKIIKVFRGVKVNEKTRLPKLLIISDSTTDPHASSFRAVAASLGFGDVQINTLAADYFIDLAPFDVIVALGEQDRGSLLNQAYLAGKSVFTFRRASEFFFNALLGSTAWSSETRDLARRVERRRNWWQNSQVGYFDPTITSDSANQYFGRNSYKCVTNSTNPSGIQFITRLPRASGQVVSARVAIKTSVAATVYISGRTDTVAEGMGAVTVTTVANTWYERTVTWTTSQGSADNQQRLQVVMDQPRASGNTLWVSAPVIEVGPTVGNFFDGATTDTKTMDYQWTGAANASESIMVSGFLTTRKNWAPNGRPGSTSGWGGASGASGASTIALRTDGSPSGNNYLRRTWTTAATNNVGGTFAGTTASDATYEIPVSPGERTTFSVQARCSKAQRLYAYLQYYNAAGTALSSGNTLTKVVNANEWTEFSLPNQIPPANAARALVIVYGVSGTGASNWAVNDYLDVCAVIVERGVAVDYVPSSFFDGASPNNVDFVYEWEGTAYASDSFEREMDPAMISPAGSTDPRTASWTGFYPIATADTYKAPSTSLPPFNVALAPGSSTADVVTSATNSVGGKFVAVHYPLTAYQYTDPNFSQFMRAMLTWLNPIVPLKEWEVQIGEFMIDRISEPHFPHEVKITGRDYTKKCKLSKFAEATQFEAGLALEDLIFAIASNARIRKILLPVTGITIGQAFFFERNTARWDAMKEICTAYNYEIFFDATGYLIIRPFRDPAKTAPALYINTGLDGQVGTYDKSTSDAQLYNHVLVSGESSDSTLVPVSAQAMNLDPASPTNIDAIGDRYWEYTSPFIETTQQAQALADSYLAIHSLEEFELNFETLLLPWVEVGDILGWEDPNPAPGDPTTFLLSSISLPLSLGPMNGVGRRVTIVGATQLGFTATTTFAQVPSGLTLAQIPGNLRMSDLV